LTHPMVAEEVLSTATVAIALTHGLLG
jgi:hypothetical protein